MVRLFAETFHKRYGVDCRADETGAGDYRTVKGRKSDGMGTENPNFWIYPKITTLKKSKLSFKYADKYGIL